MTAAADVVTIWTDGSCKKNPDGPGGWGAVLTAGEHRKELHGSDPSTTNQRMELTAAIEALRALKRPSIVRLHTDSLYVLKGITEWMPRWKANGWVNSQRKPVSNADLWRALDEARAAHDVEWLWVKGHSGDEGNERADRLADLGAREAADALSAARG
ncbi:MAG: ribonuclease HI [Jatrophihabitans sp.]|uniref:ribonuclease HI n=1 Tax=Jatrophihabitans sp. TaxID=1932789 RepID=UPI003F7D8B4E